MADYKLPFTGNEILNKLNNVDTLESSVTELKSELGELINVDFGEWIPDELVLSSNGNIGKYGSGYYCRTDYININGMGKLYTYVALTNDNVGLAFYKKDKSFISGVNFHDYTVDENINVLIPNDGYYVVITCLESKKNNFFVKTYTNLAIAYNKLDSRFDKIYEDVNLTLSNVISLGELTDGFVNSQDGSRPVVSNYKRTDFIPIKGSKIAVIDTFQAKNVGLAFFDSYYKYVGGFDGTGHNRGDVIIYDIPQKARYFIYSSPNELVGNMKAMLYSLADGIIDNTNNPIDYKGNDIIAFKNILCIGDSMTEGALNYKENGTLMSYFDSNINYPAYLKAMTNRGVTNKGSSGESTVSWYELHQNDDLSGHDACIIALGINDSRRGNTITSEERISALNSIIAKVKSDNPQIKIFLSTMINTYKTDADVQVNNDIRTVATNNTDVYLVDISKYGSIIKEVTNNYSDTASHLTAIGYRKLANHYFSYISWIMSRNTNDFAWVQFAGTERIYN